MLATLYLLAAGDHRLSEYDLIGLAADVNRLLDNAKPHLMVTDPPYGVDYDPKWRLDSGVNKKHQVRAEGVVSNDDRCDWRAAWAPLLASSVAYRHLALHSATVASSL